MSVEATLVVDFGSADTSQDITIIEPDDILNIDEEGEVISSFSPGDSIYFRTHFSNNIILTDLIATTGDIQNMGVVTRQSEEETLFVSREPDSPTQYTLGYLPGGAIGITHYGRQGSLTRTQHSNGVVQYESSVDQVPFYTKFSYSYRSNLYLLRTPEITLAEDETYTIVIVAYVDVEEADACNNS